MFCFMWKLEEESCFIALNTIDINRNSDSRCSWKDVNCHLATIYLNTVEVIKLTSPDDSFSKAKILLILSSGFILNPVS